MAISNITGTPNAAPPAAAEAASSGIPLVVKRNMLYIAAAQALVGVGTQLTPSLGALIAVRLIGSPAFAGVATSLLGLSRVLVSYPMGTVTDRYGRKVGLIAGLLVAMLGAVITGFSVTTASFVMFMAGIFVFGCGIGGVQQLRVAAADMFPPARRAEGVGMLLTGSMVGSFGGTGLIALANALGPQWHMDPAALAWFIAPASFLPALLLVMLVHPDPKYIGANLGRYWRGYVAPAPLPAPAVAAKVSPLEYARDYPKLATFVSSFFVQGNMSMMMALTALALDAHGHDLSAISLAVAIHVVGMFGLSLPLGWLADRAGRKPVMLGGVIVGGISSVVIVASSDYWVVVLGSALVGVGWAGVNVAATALLSDIAPAAERGRVIGSNDTFASLAHVSMPIAGGLLAQAFGLQCVGWTTLALSLIPAAFLLRLQEPAPGRFPQSSYNRLGE